MTRKNFILSDPQVIFCPKIFAKNSTIKLIVRCVQCNNHVTISLNAYWKRRQRGPWACQNCLKPLLTETAKKNPLYQNPEYRQKFAELHNDPEYYSKVHSETARRKISASSKKAWQDPIKRKRHLSHRQTNHYKLRISEWAKQQWANPAYRQHQSELRATTDYVSMASKRSQALWADPAYRALIITALDKARPHSAPKTNISSLQSILYHILDDLKITYYKEGPQTIIGPIMTTKNRFEGYSFDCLVIHNNKKLLIECNGDYWHKDKVRHGRDQSKATFVNNYFGDYELLVIWEYEYRSPTRIKQIISEKLGLSKPADVKFDFKNVTVTTEPVTQELQCFLATNHYLANVGRAGSCRVVARLNNTIIGAAIFSHPTRKESYERLNINKSQVLELTRFCIRNSYHRKNFGSWLLSRSMKIVKQQIKTVEILLSFADAGFGHNGIIYKASNWQLDGQVKPDYWYSDGTNWYHKKSVWDLAKKNSQTESEYASTHNLKKVMGREKFRFIYKFNC